MNKTFILPFVLSCLSSICVAQNWTSSNRIYGNSVSPVFSKLDNHNNLIVYNEFSDTIFTTQNYISFGNKDFFIVKFDDQGNTLWENHFGSNNLDISGGISVDSNNDIYLGGTFSGTLKFSPNDTLVSTGSYDFFIAKYSSSGDFIWSKILGSFPSLQSIKSLELTEDDHFLISGFYRDSIYIGEIPNHEILYGNNNINNFVAKISLDGDVKWYINLLGDNNSSRITSIAISKTGYYFGGSFIGQLYFNNDTITTLSDAYDNFIFKTDLNGNYQWVRTISGYSVETFRNIRTDKYDNVFILGNFSSSTLFVDSTNTITVEKTTGSSDSDPFIGKYNKSGNLQWFITRTGLGKDIYLDFALFGDIIYASGYFSDKLVFNQDTIQTTDINNEDAFLAAFNNSGDPISGISIKGDGNYRDAANHVSINENLDAFVTGYFNSENILIGDSSFNQSAGNKSFFFSKYSHPFKTTFTAEKNPTCNGSSDGMLTTTPYFGVPPYTYAWSHNPGVNDSVATNLSAGTYTVTITDSRDSTAVGTANVGQPQPITINKTTTDVTCYNGSDGSIDISVSGGNNGYSYNWSGGSGAEPTNEDQTGLIAGTYYLAVSDEKNCTAYDTITLNQPLPVTFGATTIVGTNADVDTGRVNIVPEGGTLPYATYEWTGPESYTSTDDTITNLAGGNYYLTLTDANSCLYDTSFVVPSSDLFIAYIQTISHVSCNGLNDGAAAVDKNRGAGNYKYIWINEDTGTDLGNNQASITGLDSSNYSVSVIDLDALPFDTATVSFTIKEPTLLTALAAGSNPSCHGESDGYINAVISGGSLPYDYSWTNGSTNEDLTNLPGTGELLTLTVTDANGCQAEASESLTDPAAIALTMDHTDPECTGELSGTATVNPTGGVFPYTYVWDDPGNQTEQEATALGAGSYHVTVTDQNECFETTSVTLNDPAPLEITNTDITQITCNGAGDGIIDLEVSGGTGMYTYTWDHTAENTDSVYGLSPGDYAVSVTDANNCGPVETGASISQPDAIVIDTSVIHNECFGDANGEILITSTGGSGIFTYEWAHTSSESNQLTGLAAGNYQVTISDGSCDPIVYDIPVNQPGEITVSIDSVHPACNGDANGSIALNVSGGTPAYSYSWDHSATDTNRFEGLTAGNYAATITDAAGCMKLLEVSLNNPEILEITGTDVTQVNCNGYDNGSISLTVSGGTGSYTYNWDHSAENTATVTGLAAGEYAVTVSDENQCTDLTTAAISEPDTVLIDITTTQIDCNGQEEGEILIDATGGSGSFTYEWGHTTSGFSELGGLAAGTYDVTVSDGQCPPFEYSLDISEPEALSVDIDTSNATCHSDNDGAIIISVAGGSGIYSYKWSHTATDTNRFTSLVAGNYSVTVSDGACPPLSYENIPVTQPDSFYVASIDSSHVSEFGARDGFIQVNMSNGIPPLRYSLNGGTVRETNTFNDLGPGIYTVVINDANQCGPVTTGPIEIKEPPSAISGVWASDEISIFPNPARNTVYLRFQGLQEDIAQVSIINMLGELIFDATYRDVLQNSELEINTEKFSPGTYFIIINQKRAPHPLIIY